MRNHWLALLIVMVVVQVSHAETSPKTFRFHVPSEPASLDPALVQSSEASYFLNNVFRGLYSYDNEAGLIEEGAKTCQFKGPLKLECELENRLWSDGSAIVADDYVRSFQRLVGKSGKNSGVELLKNLRNMKAVHSGSKPVSDLGIRAVSKTKLIFEFENPDPDFLYKLCSSVLVPVKSDAFPVREKSMTAVVNGPYKVASWTPGRRVRLEMNPRYQRGGLSVSTNRPPVEILFIDDDQTAFNLYEQGELTFLRRLPTTLIARSKARPDFIQIPVARFDYLGLNPKLSSAARDALAHALDFAELARIYDALGTPGCPSLPRSLMDEETCVHFDLKRAQSAWSHVENAERAKRFTLGFSKLGGDDIKKGAEWEQAQWKKNLGAAFDLEPAEQGVYLARLHTKPPDVFRKGIGLERPTCLAALETFTGDGPENFVKFESAEYEKVVSALTKAASVKQKKALCSKGVRLLVESNRVLPLGRIHFTLLARPEFKGWSLNEMNQLDLSRLRL